MPKPTKTSPKPLAPRLFSRPTNRPALTQQEQKDESTFSHKMRTQCQPTQGVQQWRQKNKERIIRLIYNDPEIQEIIHRELKRRGVTIHELTPNQFSKLAENLTITISRVIDFFIPSGETNSQPNPAATPNLLYQIEVAATTIPELAATPLDQPVSDPELSATPQIQFTPEEEQALINQKANQLLDENQVEAQLQQAMTMPQQNKAEQSKSLLADIFTGAAVAAGKAVQPVRAFTRDF